MTDLPDFMLQLALTQLHYRAEGINRGDAPRTIGE